MKKYIVFDNGSVTADRYTIIDRESGNVFAAGESDMTVRYCGNCADHRVALYGAGWRQMPINRRVVEAETENYVHNAQLNPAWLGSELPQEQWSGELHDLIGRIAMPNLEGSCSMPLIPYAGLHEESKPPKSAIAQ